MKITLYLRRWYWHHRLASARRYRAALDRVQDMDRRKAQYELDHCETMLARADADAVAARADRALRARR